MSWNQDMFEKLPKQDWSHYSIVKQVVDEFSYDGSTNQLTFLQLHSKTTTPAASWLVFLLSNHMNCQSVKSFENLKVGNWGKTGAWCSNSNYLTKFRFRRPKP